MAHAFALLPAVAVALLLPIACGAGQDPKWRTIDPENCSSSKPAKAHPDRDAAGSCPKAVERVKLLARERVYEGCSSTA